MKAKTSKTRKVSAKTWTTTKARRRTTQTKGRIVPDATGHSVIKPNYRDRYEDGGCGDALVRKLHKYLETDDGTTDLVKLQQLAERNGVWASRYASLNQGLVRMVVANRVEETDASREHHRLG